MKAALVSIGNSKGIRLPAVFLRECNIAGAVELAREDDRIIIKPIRKKRRKGWDAAFKKMRQRGEDSQLLDEGIDRDLGEWEWK